MKKIMFLFLNQNICCGYSKELSQPDDSSEHPKQTLKMMGKKIYTVLHSKFLVYLDLWYKFCLILCKEQLGCNGLSHIL